MLHGAHVDLGNGMGIEKTCDVRVYHHGDHLLGGGLRIPPSNADCKQLRLRGATLKVITCVN